MSLLQTRRFLPLFVTQFLGAFNDNLLKNALVMLITYRLAAETGSNAQILVTLAAGIFILPFFLFSATAGQVADKFDRATITRIIKLSEIGIMCVAIIGFYAHSTSTLLGALFLMGVHSAFFGPIKYALLPQHLRADELLSGNAYIEAGTFLAILLGTIIGGLLVLHDQGIFFISIALMLVAICGYISSRYIPSAPPLAPNLVINRNIFAETFHLLAYSRQNRIIFLCLMGISWFWLVGATFLAQFPTYAKDTLHADETVVTLFLTLFSIGIGVGSFLCNRLLKGRIQTTYVPISALAMSLFGIDLYFASQTPIIPEQGLIHAWQFMSHIGNWRLLGDLFFLSVSAGLYIVPLYALMQHHSDPAYRARIIAANNIMNALFMVSSAILIILLLSLSFSIPQIFLTISLANLAVALYICKLLPDSLYRSLARGIFTLLYRVEVKGLEHYEQAGDRVLIIANHTSFLDAALVAAYLPHKATFAVNSHIAQKWWFKPFTHLVNTLALDPTNPLATKKLIEHLRADHRCMIFPEGRITVTGTLMKIYEGPGMMADKADAPLLPIRIEGPQYTPFSRMKGKYTLHWFPKVTLTIMPARHFSLPDHVKGRKRRQLASAQLYDLMSNMMFDSSPYEETFFESLIKAQKIHGRHHDIIEDTTRKPLHYGQLLTRSFILGRTFKTIIPQDNTIGLMLPTSIAMIASFIALQAYGRITALLNATAGAQALQSACHTADIKTIITSRQFVELARLQNVIDHLQQHEIRILYLEDIAPRISSLTKIYGLLASFAPRFIYHRLDKERDPHKPAVILFTSGSEGAPKAVILSAANIQANRYQIASRVDFGPHDKVFNCLPMFHAFGLTGATLLPLLSGIHTFYYPSPLHYRIIPELIYDTNATILFGTDTFLAGYARFAHPYDLYSIRYIFAGAEKLKDETRNVYIDKFGLRIFEGYGATETAPVITVNTPMHYKPHSVGRLMPAIEARLEPVTGIDDAAKLWVKGPNIMLGYYLSDQPATLQPLADGWYDTGDIVAQDDTGFIFIKGRAKRFAKIGGEMVSLSALESALSALWPDHTHVAITIPDDKKGEQIIILTDYNKATREEIADYFKIQNMPAIATPRKIMLVDAIPLLGTGKIDYQSAKKLVAQEDTNQLG
jgi:acyl-[acyl-carrier-protein]-phospholipid O-acyltransferase/long-chain-fatty-acid--[acyl-carrier-protein] ligase